MRNEIPLLLSVCCLPGYPLVADTPGVVAEKPASGRFVQVDGGYMVPYEVKIPGTDESFRMLPIPSGRFQMGSPTNEVGRKAVEGPQLDVVVSSPFWMAQCEVTQGEYRHYMGMYSVFKKFAYSGRTRITDENRVDAVTAPTTLYEPGIIYENGDHVDMPMITVTHFAARQYSKWLSMITDTEFRLPTEAEWEYACRAGSTTAYHFGNNPKQLSKYAWFKQNSYDEGLRKVGTKSPNAWGLHDMHGNVAEWVHDYCEAYKDPDRSRDAARDWVRSPKLDPRAVRGGSWLHEAKQCRSAARLKSDHEDWNENDPDLPRSPWWLTSGDSIGVGFRLVRPFKKMSSQEKTEFWNSCNEDLEYDLQTRIEEGRGAIGFANAELMKELQAAKQRENQKSSGR